MMALPKEIYASFQTMLLPPSFSRQRSICQWRAPQWMPQILGPFFKLLKNKS